MTVLETDSKIGNFYWAGDQFQPPVRWTPEGATTGAPQGQFALALEGAHEDTIRLIRDRLGINKLFFAIHHTKGITVANYLIDLIERGVPCEAIYSVPAGHVVHVDLARGQLELSRYYKPQVDGPEAFRSVAEGGRRIREDLEMWFARLAREFSSRHIVVALSGGLDSSVIAALARRHFARVTAYTYTFRDAGAALSEDAVYAQRVAEFLGLPFRLVPASARDVLDTVECALLYGQDWRDFNVHCAIVNELLARAIGGDFPQREPILILTGDLQNELLADYTPVTYGGHEYYALPKVDRRSLRRALVQGLDAGDREVGIFGRHGLDVIQPYGLVSDMLLGVPTATLHEEDAKQRLVREVAGDLLPDWLFARKKVRAQIGGSGPVKGILAVLAEAGRDQAWLRKAFVRLFRIRDDAFLNSFIRIGVYRSPHTFPTRLGPNGYIS